MGRAKYDFSGWATKNDLRCSDGRTIRRDAFKGNDGQTVPLVWNHQHNDPLNVLGHALLENRENGVYAYCSFNDTPQGQNARQLVRHGDVTGLSIYANQLKQQGADVMHGIIREVSLVLASANPGAFIDSVLEHGDISDDSAIIYTGEDLDLMHADSEETVEETKNDAKETTEEGDAEKMAKEETVKDVFNTLSEKQKTVVYALIGQAIQDAKSEAKHSAIEEFMHADEETNNENETVKDVFDTLSEKQKTVVYALIGQAIQDAKGGKNNEDDDESDDEGDTTMKHNVFDNEEEYEVLSHSDIQEIFADAKRSGSLREAVIAHGMENIEMLFPDAQSVTNTPEFIKEPDDWVAKVMKGVRHTPFSRIKSIFADITEADARAKGYIKGNRKIEEVFSLLKRVTTPTTVYKKQKIDRDDQIDITDFDVVAWLKTEMRMMLDEELARAFLIGDGRNVASDDKINEQCIRPIWTDDDLFTIKKAIALDAAATADQKAKAFIRAVVKARKDYRGTGTPDLYCCEDILTDCLLLEDLNGRVIYDTVEKLKTTLRVKDIITVPPMEGQSRVKDGKTYMLGGIVVNLQDYNVGADKGGAVNLFDDFDIDYNAQKYLIETRCSGALIKPFSAIALEFVYSAILITEAENPSTMVLGKAVSSLQSDVIVHDNFIKGTLKYVTGYTGYSGLEEEQSGNYLALKFEDTENATTTVQLTGGPRGPVELDSDKNCVFRITNKATQKIKVVSTLDGETITKTYSLAGLVLENG